MDFPNRVKAKKSGALFPGARQGCYLMEKADTGALTTLELLNIPEDLGSKLLSALERSFALSASGASNDTSCFPGQAQVLLQGFCFQCNTKHLSQVPSW